MCCTSDLFVSEAPQISKRQQRGIHGVSPCPNHPILQSFVNIFGNSPVFEFMAYSWVPVMRFHHVLTELFRKFTDLLRLLSSITAKSEIHQFFGIHSRHWAPAVSFWYVFFSTFSEIHRLLRLLNSITSRCLWRKLKSLSSLFAKFLSVSEGVFQTKIKEWVELQSSFPSGFVSCFKKPPTLRDSMHLSEFQLYFSVKSCQRFRKFVNFSGFMAHYWAPTVSFRYVFRLFRKSADFYGC